jgi:hypothetical protein
MFEGRDPTTGELLGRPHREPRPSAPARWGQRPGWGQQQHQAEQGKRREGGGRVVHGHPGGGRQRPGPDLKPVACVSPATPLAVRHRAKANSSQPTGWRGRQAASTAPTVAALTIATIGPTAVSRGVGPARRSRPSSHKLAARPSITSAHSAQASRPYATASRCVGPCQLPPWSSLQGAHHRAPTRLSVLSQRRHGPLGDQAPS